MEDLPLKPQSTQFGMRAQYRAIHRLIVPRAKNLSHPSNADKAVAAVSVRIPDMHQLLLLRLKWLERQRQERQERQQKDGSASGSGSGSGRTEHIPPYTFVLGCQHDLEAKLDFSWRESFFRIAITAIVFGCFMMVPFYLTVLVF